MKFADSMVLDKDFMQVPEDELARNDVLLTVVGGKVVWAKVSFGGLEQRSAQVAVTEQQK